MKDIDLEELRQYLHNKDISSNQLIHVFDILLREKMISEQEYYKAINRIKEKYNTIYKNNQ